MNAPSMRTSDQPGQANPTKVSLGLPINIEASTAPLQARCKATGTQWSAAYPAAASAPRAPARPCRRTQNDAAGGSAVAIYSPTVAALAGARRIQPPYAYLELGNRAADRGISQPDR